MTPVSRKTLEFELRELGYTFDEVVEGSKVKERDWPIIGPALAEHISMLEGVAPAVDREPVEVVAWLNFCAATGACTAGLQCESELASEPLMTVAQHEQIMAQHQAHPAAQAVPDEWRNALQGLVDDIENLAGESDGVIGLHLNGDTARWGELLPGGRFERLTYLAVARELLDTQHGLEEIQQQYGVRYYRDQHITVNGRPGVIKEANRQYLRVQFEGVDGLRNCHPTWEVQAAPTPPAGEVEG